MCLELAKCRGALVISFPSGSVFATARGAVVSGTMKQSLLCRFDVRLFALPDFQSRLLDGAGGRERVLVS
jgi:hypothetical protein